MGEAELEGGNVIVELVAVVLQSTRRQVNRHRLHQHFAWTKVLREVGKTKARRQGGFLPQVEIQLAKHRPLRTVLGLELVHRVEVRLALDAGEQMNQVIMLVVPQAQHTPHRFIGRRFQARFKRKRLRAGSMKQLGACRREVLAEGSVETLG